MVQKKPNERQNPDSIVRNEVDSPQIKPHRSQMVSGIKAV